MKQLNGMKSYLIVLFNPVLLHLQSSSSEDAHVLLQNKAGLKIEEPFGWQTLFGFGQGIRHLMVTKQVFILLKDG